MKVRMCMCMCVCVCVLMCSWVLWKEAGVRIKNICNILCNFTCAWRSRHCCCMQLEYYIISVLRQVPRHGVCATRINGFVNDSNASSQFRFIRPFFLSLTLSKFFLWWSFSNCFYHVSSPLLPLIIHPTHKSLIVFSFTPPFHPVIVIETIV